MHLSMHLDSRASFASLLLATALRAAADPVVIPAHGVLGKCSTTPVNQASFVASFPDPGIRGAYLLPDTEFAHLVTASAAYTTDKTSLNAVQFQYFQDYSCSVSPVTQCTQDTVKAFQMLPSGVQCVALVNMGDTAMSGDLNATFTFAANVTTAVTAQTVTGSLAGDNMTNASGNNLTLAPISLLVIGALLFLVGAMLAYYWLRRSWNLRRPGVDPLTGSPLLNHDDKYRSVTLRGSKSVLSAQERGTFVTGSGKHDEGAIAEHLNGIGGKVKKGEKYNDDNNDDDEMSEVRSLTSVISFVELEPTPAKGKDWFV